MTLGRVKGWQGYIRPWLKLHIKMSQGPIWLSIPSADSHICIWFLINLFGSFFDPRVLPKMLDDHCSLLKHYGLVFANIRSFWTLGIWNFAWIYLSFFFQHLGEMWRSCTLGWKSVMAGCQTGISNISKYQMKMSSLHVRPTISTRCLQWQGKN